MTRASSWTNADNLVVGFGPNTPERNLPAETQDMVYKIAKISFDAVTSTAGAAGARVTIPAGSVLHRVVVRITEAHAGGTSITFGDAGTPAGCVTAAQWGNPALNASFEGQGAYMFTATEGKLPGRAITTNTDFFFTRTGTYTTGKAEVYIEYI